MKILAVCTGKIKTYSWNEKEFSTAIVKSQQSSVVAVYLNGLEGDEQANLKAHGGRDKAIYAFSMDSLEFWQRELRMRQIQFGQFGENLSVDHLDEKNIFVGDTFEVGTCIIQAVQAREPCFKQEVVFNQPLIEKFKSHGRCGVYFRVLQEGQIKAGDSLKLIRSETVKASISELFEIYKNQGQVDSKRAAELAAIPSMNEKWRTKLSASLTK